MSGPVINASWALFLMSQLTVGPRAERKSPSRREGKPRLTTGHTAGARDVTDDNTLWLWEDSSTSAVDLQCDCMPQTDKGLKRVAASVYG